MFTPSSFLVIFLLALGGNFHLTPFFSTSNTFLQNFFRSKKNSLEFCLSKISLLCILHEGYTFWILFQSSTRSLSSLSLSSLLFTFETVSLNCPSCPGTLSQPSLAWFSLSGSCGYRPVPPGLVQQFNSWLSGIFVFSVSYYSSAFPSHSLSFHSCHCSLSRACLCLPRLCFLCILTVFQSFLMQCLGKFSLFICFYCLHFAELLASLH